MYIPVIFCLCCVPGASPDGMIRHADGTCEVLEVKCSSPFISDPTSTSSGGKGGSKGGNKGKGRQQGGSRRMTISQRPLIRGVGAWHIPQIQLEILCAGPKVTHTYYHISCYILVY